MKETKPTSSPAVAVQTAKVESKTDSIVKTPPAEQTADVRNVQPCFEAIVAGFVAMGANLDKDSQIFGHKVLSQKVNEVSAGRFKSVVEPVNKFLKSEKGEPVNAHLVYKRLVPTKKGETCQIRNIKSGKGFVSYISGYGLYFTHQQIDFTQPKEAIAQKLPVPPEPVKEEPKKEEPKK